VRERVVAQLANVAPELAESVAKGLGFQVPRPLPLSAPKIEAPEVTQSPALSLTSRPGEGSPMGRRVAVLAGDGSAAEALLGVHAELSAAGVVPRVLASRLGPFGALDAESTVEAMPGVLFDAAVVAAGDASAPAMLDDATVDFLRDVYRHGKPLLVIGDAAGLLQQLGLAGAQADGGVLDDVDDFVVAVGGPRQYQRELALMS
jgi:catalase